jgi:hypothetical protein
MINKPFVSIYFLADKLQIAQLDSSNKVKRIATVAVPEGIIKGTGGSGNSAFAYHVEDVSALARILKSSWNKLHIKQRSVGLIVPEFSTFSKLFSVPKLTIAEVDEAIRWQMQEIIPTDIKNLVLDWKIAAKSDDGYQILVAAMQKSILKTYIASVEQAGLFPLVVEMPSLSLARATGFEPVGTLIVYREKERFILVVGSGEQVFAASVVDADENIYQAAKRMLGHYSAAGVKKVQVCGSGMDANIVEQLKKLDLEFEPLELKIGGLEKASVQEYLIPLSLQQKHSIEPANPATINLLPPLLVAKYKSASTRLRVWGMTLIVTLFVWFCFLVALGSFLFLGQQKAQFESDNPAADRFVKERREMAEKVTAVNVLVQNVDNIRSATLAPQILFDIVEKAGGESVAIRSYKMDLDKGQAIVKGVALDRSALIALKNNLENEPLLGDIEIPISSLEVERDLDFQITFSYLPLVQSKPAR